MVANYQLKSQRVYPSGPGGDKLIQKESEHLTCMQKCCENGGLIALLLTGESFLMQFFNESYDCLGPGKDWTCVGKTSSSVRFLLL